MIDHDYGLAPNPFGNYCTIAVCKPNLRKSQNLNIGDWIIGTGSKSLEKSSGLKCVSRLIYAMQVSEIIDLNSYWLDSRFQYKKPVMNGTLRTIFGDNFYYLNDDKKWAQIDSAHNNIDGKFNDEHFRKDTGGKNALISEVFYFFGQNAPALPISLLGVCHTTQGLKIVYPEELADLFLEWLHSNFEPGVQGLPISWLNY